MSNCDHRTEIQLTDSNEVEVREFAGAVGVAKLNDRSIILYCGNKRITMQVGDYLFKDCKGKIIPAE